MDVYVLLNTTRSEIPRQWSVPSASRVVYVDESWTTRLDATRLGLLRRLRATAHGPGTLYMLKPFLPWLLPTARRAIVVDFDLYCLEPLPTLWHEFDNFSASQMIGVARDVMGPKLYPNFEFAANGGVQLLHLERMRKGTYESAMRRIASSMRIGYLGDQTFYTHIGRIRPEWIHPLSCRYNRQLNLHFSMPIEAYACEDGCAIIHGNQRRWKRDIRRWQESPTRAWSLQWIEPFPSNLRAAFANCEAPVEAYRVEPPSPSTGRSEMALGRDVA